MNARQKRFCDEYLIDSNATQAALRAGYSPKTAYSHGQRMLKNVEVKNYLDAQLALLHTQKTADAQEVLEYLTSVMRGEQTEKTVRGVGDGVQEIADIAVGARERLRAAELLGKRHGLFTDRLSLDVQPVVLLNDLPDEAPSSGKNGAGA